MSGKTSKTKWAAVIVGAFVVLTAVGCGGGAASAPNGSSAASPIAQSGGTGNGTFTIPGPNTEMVIVSLSSNATATSTTPFVVKLGDDSAGWVIAHDAKYQGNYFLPGGQVRSAF